MKLALRICTAVTALVLVLLIGLVEIAYIDWSDGPRWGADAASDKIGFWSRFAAGAALLATGLAATGAVRDKMWELRIDWAAAGLAGVASLGTIVALVRVPGEYDDVRPEEALQGLSLGWFVVAFSCVVFITLAVAVPLVPHRPLSTPTVGTRTLAGPASTHSGPHDSRPTASGELHPQAVLAFVLGLLGSSPCFFYLAPIGWWLGHRTMREIDQFPGRWKGRGWAIAGVVLGVIGVAFAVLFAMLLVVALLVGVIGSSQTRV